MKKLLAALLMCCSTVAYGQNTTTETTHQMGDDGYVQVTIPFTFQFYDRQFTESWMYDNGIISFVNPSDPSALPPWQWNAVPLSQANGNYFIAPLWADISPKQGATKYTTTTDGTFLTYSWNNIIEFYSQNGQLRFNSFNTTIKPDGSISTRYDTINLQSSAISVGTVGNVSAGEYNQIYWSSCCNSVTTGMIADWTIGGVPTPQVPTQPEPVYVAPPMEEPIIETVAASSIAIAEPTIQAAPTTTNNVSAIMQAATESSPGSVMTSAIAATTNTDNKMSAADAQAIARTNQRNANQLVMSVVNTSIENSTSQLATVDSESMNSSESYSTSAQSANSSVNSLGQNSSNYGDTFNPTTTNATSLANFSRLPGSFKDDGSSEAQNTGVAVESIDSTDNTGTTIAVSEIVTTIADETNPTSVRSLAVNSIKQIELEEDQEKKTIEIVDMAKDSSLLELNNSGVLLTELQVLPIGYNVYLTTILKDVAFYAPKAIYRNQTVVDNAPAQRLLKFASDAKFDQMVSQQYGEQN